jgi:hypothetical protein
MTQTTSKRRGHGEDSIYWDASRNRYIGAVNLGFSPAGTRIRSMVPTAVVKRARSNTGVRSDLSLARV